MAKNKQKASKPVKQVGEPNKIEVNLANAPLVMVKMLEAINNNLISLKAYLVNKDMEDGRPKRS